MTSPSPSTSPGVVKGWIVLLSLATSVLALVAVLAIAVPSFRQQVRLSIGRHDPGFTALSFVSPSPPMALQAGAVKEFTFKVDNRTGRRQTYRVMVTESSSGTTRTLSETALTLPDARSSVRSVTVEFPSAQTVYLLVISVGGNNSITQYVATS